MNNNSSSNNNNHSNEENIIDVKLIHKTETCSSSSMISASTSVFPTSTMPIINIPTNNTNKFSNIDLIREVFNHIKKSNSNLEKSLNVSYLSINYYYLNFFTILFIFFS